MHVLHLDDWASPLAVESAPSFRHKEWRTLICATGAPGRIQATAPSNTLLGGRTNYGLPVWIVSGRIAECRPPKEPG